VDAVLLVRGKKLRKLPFEAVKSGNYFICKAEKENKGTNQGRLEGSCGYKQAQSLCLTST